MRKSDLHWWAFWELFEGLGEDEKIMKIISWRAADLSGVKDKARRSFLRRMKRRFAPAESRSEEEMYCCMRESLARNLGM